jgi:molybdopterin synthase catalytic subunit
LCERAKGAYVSEPKERGAAWTEERGTSDEGRRRLKSAPAASEQGSRVRLIAVRESELSVDEVRAAVADPAAGGIALFAGAVRDSDHDRGVTGLSYSAHPSAAGELRQIAEAVAEKFPVLGIAAVHRVGDLAIGDLAVVVAVACPHRAEAFDACRALIDELKASVPIWKHQRFGDGTSEWVGSA